MVTYPQLVPVCILSHLAVLGAVASTYPQEYVCTGPFADYKHNDCELKFSNIGCYQDHSGVGSCAQLCTTILSRNNERRCEDWCEVFFSGCSLKDVTTEATDAAAAVSTPSPDNPEQDLHKTLTWAVPVGIVVTALIVTGGLLCYCYKKSKLCWHKERSPDTDSEMMQLMRGGGGDRPTQEENHSVERQQQQPEVAVMVAQTCTNPNTSNSGLPPAAENGMRAEGDTDPSSPSSAPILPAASLSAHEEAAAHQPACSQANPCQRHIANLHFAHLSDATGSDRSVPSVSDYGYSTNHSTRSNSLSDTGTRAKVSRHRRASSLGFDISQLSSNPTLYTARTTTLKTAADGKKVFKAEMAD